ncbi:type III-B CRISPR module RAMP protein Cmr6 [Dehalobacterium formicoaceticum]|uniref:Type III-B CRISPR module RAMP protein Cmr6 n=1 Tax=Dehalobacterium formicoaceticum TaxID=51515 RepID=A0ABT1Y1H9_9FIRM|nr:type III-B CRISPR module RAMP protein Cmr6 [Dehalobacterium formicoaceticum]MCR6544716.1 type III-B CRISPR module RAMP protein Cmr6 [Dehalobacterium formicoaceticum]
MKSERIKVLQFKNNRGKGIIIGDNLKEYAFNIKDISAEVVSQLTKEVEVEFKVSDQKDPATITDLKIILPEKARANSQQNTSARKNNSKNQRDRQGDNSQSKGNDNSQKPLPKYLPGDTRVLIINYGDVEEISNYELMLNRFPRVQDDKFLFYKAADKKMKSSFGNYKHEFPQINFQEFSARQLRALNELGLLTKSLTLEPEWRMIVGLGGASVYETSLTLHHTYGIPYIPGSAIKGITRSWIISNCFDGNEKKALDDQGFKLIFGSQGNKGNVFFYDAFPQGKPKIIVDIMTPHYSEYYSKGKAPRDYGDTKLIPFITIAETKFCFVIGIDAQKNVAIDKDYFKGSSVMDVASTWIKKALLEHGVGAKTAVGYGIMKM